MRDDGEPAPENNDFESTTDLEPPEVPTNSPLMVMPGCSSMRARQGREMGTPSSSVAARSLSANSYFYAGSEVLYLYEMEDVSQLEPETPDDWFYLGLAMTWVDPFGALEKLEQASSYRPRSPIIKLAKSKGDQ